LVAVSFRFLFVVVLEVVIVAVFGAVSVGVAGDFSGSTTFMPSVIEMLNKLMVDVGSAPVGGDPFGSWWNVFKRAWGVVDIATGVADVTGAVAGAILAPEGSEPLDWWLLTKGLANTAFGIDDLVSPNAEQTRRAPVKETVQALPHSPVPLPPDNSGYPTTSEIASAVWTYESGDEGLETWQYLVGGYDFGNILTLAAGDTTQTWVGVPGVSWAALNIFYASSFPQAEGVPYGVIFANALEFVGKYDTISDWLNGEVSQFSWASGQSGGCIGSNSAGDQCALVVMTQAEFDFVQAAFFVPTSGGAALSLWQSLNQLLTLVPVQW